MFTDIRKWRIIERLPAKIKPYAYLMRLDRPIGTWLLLFPALWSLVLCFKTQTHSMETQVFFVLCALFCVGALIMRGAGCVINDIWDRKLDARVERTQTRPLASGEVKLFQTLLFLAGLLSIGLFILLQMNALTIQLGFLALVLVIIYPSMKRFTWWPQAFLGLTFNFGALMGWSAITGDLSLAPVLLYIGGIFWTLGYDTIYAHQDIEDDALIGIKSTARLFKNQSKKWVTGFYSFASLFYLMGIYTATESPYALLICIPAFSLLIYQMITWKSTCRKSALSLFKSNRIFGGLLLLAFIIF